MTQPPDESPGSPTREKTRVPHNEIDRDPLFDHRRTREAGTEESEDAPQEQGWEIAKTSRASRKRSKQAPQAKHIANPAILPSSFLPVENPDLSGEMDVRADSPTPGSNILLEPLTLRGTHQTTPESPETKGKERKRPPHWMKTTTRRRTLLEPKPSAQPHPEPPAARHDPKPTPSPGEQTEADQQHPTLITAIEVEETHGSTSRLDQDLVVPNLTRGQNQAQVNPASAESPSHRRNARKRHNPTHPGNGQHPSAPQSTPRNEGDLGPDPGRKILICIYDVGYVDNAYPTAVLIRTIIQQIFDTNRASRVAHPAAENPPNPSKKHAPPFFLVGNLTEVQEHILVAQQAWSTPPLSFFALPYNCPSSPYIGTIAGLSYVENERHELRQHIVNLILGNTEVRAFIQQHHDAIPAFNLGNAIRALTQSVHLTFHEINNQRL
ncbi:hypothetical protein HGRIS_001085 [Hohenbuehelia grisea]|uniref:Uncharacterized protein n=1 Tax=Hohenbuehelia grisea TaxID=104357 RepID=A0ABR3JNF5_9AGAR